MEILYSHIPSPNMGTVDILQEAVERGELPITRVRVEADGAVELEFSTSFVVSAHYIAQYIKTLRAELNPDKKSD